MDGRVFGRPELRCAAVVNVRHQEFLCFAITSVQDGLRSPRLVVFLRRTVAADKRVDEEAQAAKVLATVCEAQAGEFVRGADARGDKSWACDVERRSEAATLGAEWKLGQCYCCAGEGREGGKQAIEPLRLLRVEGAGRPHVLAGQRRPEDVLEENDRKTRTVESEGSSRIFERVNEVKNEVCLLGLG